MPRRPLIKTDKFPYHITSRSNNKEWFYIPPKICWEIFREKMQASVREYETKFYSFVLMSNHFHMLLSTPHANLGDVSRHFLTEVSKGIQREASRINHVFGGRYRWSLLDNCFSAAYVFKYVYRNPVRAKICNKVEDYSLSTLMSDSSKHFPMIEKLDSSIWRMIPKDFPQLVDWLNQPTRKEAESLIRNGLRHHTFNFTKCNEQQELLRELRRDYKVERDEIFTQLTAHHS